ncbi:MAG: MauE/DoxX family redox-associated membrane protein [Terriglobia bacterium]
MRDPILHWLTSLRTGTGLARLVLAAIFLYAGFTKGLYPFEEPFLFAIAVSSYQLLPEWAVIFVSRALPWLEIALGLVLLVGWKLRYVAAFTALLLTAFMVAMGITYARGIEADCGCFGFGEPISPLTLARDSLFLGLAFYLAVSAWRAPSVRTG